MQFSFFLFVCCSFETALLCCQCWMQDLNFCLLFFFLLICKMWCYCLLLVYLLYSYLNKVQNINFLHIPNFHKTLWHETFLNKHLYNLTTQNSNLIIILHHDKLWLTRKYSIFTHSFWYTIFYFFMSIRLMVQGKYLTPAVVNWSVLNSHSTVYWKIILQTEKLA